MAATLNWLDVLNDTVLCHYRTRVIGGFAEPFYKAASDNAFAEIRFTQDYERSALHELGHWCVAGEQRRRQDDYGYWYAPDGRDDRQQRLFFQVEVRPQAIEKHFCVALGVPFAVSVDNLGNPAIAGVDEFSQAVDDCFARYGENGLPGRARQIYQCLADWKSLHPGS
jgi:elongation factor P hydroxylase